MVNTLRAGATRWLGKAMATRVRNLRWVFFGDTTVIILYGLVVIASQYTPMPDESVRERIGGIVLLTWYALPCLLLLIGQLFLARTEAARFTVFLTSLIVTGLLVVMNNGPQSSGYLGYRPTGIATMILFFGVTLPPVGLTSWVSGSQCS
jgi:hypothetical protein